MIRRTAGEVATLSGGRLIQGASDQQVVGVATDTRKDMTGNLFVPIVGERFDGHDFIAQAQKQGAVAALWQTGRPRPQTEMALIEVDDTLQGLQRLAQGYREQLNVTVVGVTGSNGKTSTKDMITSVLSERFKVQKTLGNLNNHIGLPLMLLALEEDTEVAVLEMGMNHAGEIERLARFAHPSLGVITNIGEAHIEFLGSRSGIADAKCELIEQLPADGKAILFGDEPLLRERADKTQAEVLWFGLQEGNDVRAVSAENLGLLGSRFSLPGDETVYTLPVMGQHQLTNALAAIAVGLELGLTRKEIRDGLGKVKLTARRLEVKKARVGGMIIDDSYNASPTSMKAALKVLAEVPGDLRVAVLGGMLELGADTARMHEEIGAFVARTGIERLVCIGELARLIADGAVANGFSQAHLFVTDDKEQASHHVEALLQEATQTGADSATVLVKASLGIGLDVVVKQLIGR
ncbi:MAG TPA: UDP-N-acetylmuramoyl-tripeptide--D-alanyl-D-alanine ligase [Bacilli bacterium]|nr:UDP-N-acetylmuramoyl-tripeptide--D-alanyl-D-alanine ligase [Bacilli bacterium]